MLHSLSRIGSTVLPASWESIQPEGRSQFRVLWLAFFLSGITAGLTLPLLSVRMVSKGLSLEQYGVLQSIASLGVVLTQVWVGKASDAMGRRKPLVVGFLLSSVLVLVLFAQAVSNAQFGWITSIQAWFEMPLMFGLGMMSDRWNMPLIVGCGMAAAGLRWLFLSMADNSFWLYPVQSMHALGITVTEALAVAFVARLVPARVLGTSLGWRCCPEQYHDHCSPSRRESILPPWNPGDLPNLRFVGPPRVRHSPGCRQEQQGPSWLYNSSWLVDVGAILYQNVIFLSQPVYG